MSNYFENINEIKPTDLNAKNIEDLMSYNYEIKLTNQKHCNKCGHIFDEETIDYIDNNRCPFCGEKTSIANDVYFKLKEILNKDELDEVYKPTIQTATINNLVEMLLCENENDRIFERAKKRFIDLCLTTGREYIVDGSDMEFADFEQWNLRDLVSEAAYQMKMRETELYDSTMRNEYNRYKRFVKAYRNYIDDLVCVTKHSSEYDN